VVTQTHPHESLLFSGAFNLQELETILFSERKCRFYPFGGPDAFQNAVSIFH
jgi:hypothetical protein